ncbi:MAG TPA: hypothetical protein VG206_04530 [Terriglobia bacterium]|nr:hypothetical protein [Terriglobia bacterium]
MAAKFAAYAEYRRRTARFIPGEPGGRLFRMFLGWIPNRQVALAVSSAAVVVLVIGGGLAPRRYTIGRVPEDRTFAIAVWSTSPESIQRVVSTALSSPQVRQALASEPDSFFTAHLLPADYGIVNMFAGVRTDHPMFSHLAQLDQVTDLTAKMTPIVIAEVRVRDPNSVVVTVPPRRSFWGDITMPMFWRRARSSVPFSETPVSVLSCWRLFGTGFRATPSTVLKASNPISL